MDARSVPRISERLRGPMRIGNDRMLKAAIFGSLIGFSLFVLCLALFVMSLHRPFRNGHEATREYLTTDGKLSLSIPHDWEMLEISERPTPPYEMFAAGSPHTNVGVNVFKTPLDQPQTSKQRMLSSAISMREFIAGFELHVAGVFPAGTAEVAWFKYTCHDDAPRTCYQFYLASTEASYVVCCGARVDEFTQWDEIFLQIGRSLRLKGATPAPSSGVIQDLQIPGIDDVLKETELNQ